MATIRLLSALAVVLTVSAATPVMAATFNVASTLDAGDADPGDGACATDAGACTLRAAIEEANTHAGEDVINVPAGTYLLSLGALEITDHVRILGPLQGPRTPWRAPSAGC